MIKNVVITATAIVCMLWLSGCAELSGSKPPAKFETVMFTVTTNYVEKPVKVEREVWSTNYVEEVKTITNEVNAIVYLTNVVPKFEVKTITETITQSVPAYTFEEKTEVMDRATSIGEALNVLWPGIGSAALLVFGGVYRLWAKLRTAKATGQTLVGNIEAIREFIVRVIPDGKLVDDALVAWMIKNQGKTEAVKTLIGQMVDITSNSEAKIAAAEIKNLIDSLSK